MGDVWVLVTKFYLYGIGRCSLGDRVEVAGSRHAVVEHGVAIFFVFGLLMSGTKIENRFSIQYTKAYK
jgi:hypothetical protein